MDNSPLRNAVSLTEKYGKLSALWTPKFVVRKGVDHKAYADEECRILLIDPVGMLKKTVGGNEAVEKEEWI